VKTTQNQIHNSTAYEKKLLFIILDSPFSACMKQTQNLLSSGNYDQAIDNAVSNLRSNKDKRQTRLCVFVGRGFRQQKNGI
jgi:hypothetical protein